MTIATLLDASAILAWLWAEPGSDAVDRAFCVGDVGCTAANWAEVVAKVVASRGEWGLAEAALMGRGLVIVPVDVDDAVEAGRMSMAHPTASLGDRLCLAAGQRLLATILTVNRQWAGVSPAVVLIR